MEPFENYIENPEDEADYFRWGNKVKSPKRNMTDVHHGSSIKEVKRTLVQHPSSSRFEPLSLSNRFKILEMLNDNNNEYIYDDFDFYNECSVIQTKKSFQNEMINSYNTNYETLAFKNNESVYDIDDTMLNMNDNDNTGAMGSHHRPGNQMYQNKSNNDCYICSFITPPKITLNKKSSIITQGHNHYNKYNETYKLNMMGKFQDILDKISNDNLDHLFNQYIYMYPKIIKLKLSHTKI